MREKINTMTRKERDCRRKEEALYFSIFNVTFSTRIGQRTPWVHFILGPANYVADPGFQC